MDQRSLAPSLEAAITEGKFDGIQVDGSQKIPLSEVVLHSPIPDPEMTLCIGVNYANSNAEYKDGSKAPTRSSVIIRCPASFTGHYQPLTRPPESEQLDYECEIVLVVGKAGRRLKREIAYDLIAGLTVVNDGALRDWVRHAKFNVTQGKNFERSGSIGPWMVTADEFSPDKYENMRVISRFN